MRKQFAISTFNQQVRLRIRYDQPARRTILSRLVVHTAVFTEVRVAAPIQLVLANFIEETALSLGLATRRTPEAVRAPPLVAVLLCEWWSQNLGTAPAVQVIRLVARHADGRIAM